MQEEIIYEDLQISEVQDDITVEEIVPVIEVTDVETFDIEVSEAFPAYADIDALNHAILNNRELSDQHPITAITGLRKELDSIEALQTVYSDKKGNADYYEWADGHALGENGVGYFVSLNRDCRTISICSGDDIFGVVVDSAAFVGGQDDIARDAHYGLVATTGAVHVRCELDVAEGDYVVSNAKGVATKSSSGRGYKVVALHDIKGVPHAMINLNISADQIDLMGAELKDLDSRMDAAETNIVSAINVANEAYKKAAEAGNASIDASNKAQDALDTSNRVLDSVGSLENAATQSQIIAAQAKAIADGVMVSAGAMCQDTIDRANDALLEAEKIRKDFGDIVDNIDGDIGEAISNMQKLKEDLEPLATWSNDDKESIAGFVARADEDSATLATMVEWKDGTGTDSLAGFVQNATSENAEVQALASYGYKDDNGVQHYGAAGIMAEVDKNKSAIEAIVGKDGDIAGLQAQIDNNKSAVNIVAQRIAKQYIVVALEKDIDATKTGIVYYVEKTKEYHYYDNNAWKKTSDAAAAGLPTSIAGIQAKTDDNSASIGNLVSWQGDTNSAMARIEQKADANGAYIQSTVANLDKYSVGPYSQAYGFTRKQAQSVLEEGMIYVPTDDNIEETYVGEGDLPTYKRTFSKHYLYRWGEVSDGYDWVTVDQNYSKDKLNTSAPSVFFSNTAKPTVAQCDTYGYWYTNGATLTGTAAEYEPYTLYKWGLYDTKDDEGNSKTERCWIPVATLAGNSQSRAVSQIRQDANSIELSVTTMDNKYAGLKAEIDTNKSSVTSLSNWKNGKDSSKAIIRQESKNGEASVVIAALLEKENADGTVEVDDMASLVLNVTKDANGTATGLSIDADYINFEGSSFDVTIRDEVDKAVDDIQVGGRNLIIGSVKYTKDSPLSWTPTSNDSYNYYDNELSVYVERGKTYILSCTTNGLWSTHGTVGNRLCTIWLATKETHTVHDMFQGNGTETGRKYWTYEAQETETKTIRVNAYGAGNATVSFWDFKLEEGNKVTDWTPAPEDMVSADKVITCINASKEGVTIQGDKINITGNTTFTSLSNKFDGVTTTENNTTVIDGGKIKTNSIMAKNLNLTGFTVSASSNVSGLSTVATSGSYNDLGGKPDLSTYATNGQLADYLKTNDLSTKLGNLNVAYRGDVETTQTTDTTTGIITTTSTYTDANGKSHTTTTYTTEGANYVLLNRDNQWGTNDSLVKISKDGLMEANNAIISGKVYASEGDIGGNIIDSRGLHITSGCFNIDGNGDIITQNTWTPSITINPDGVTCSIGVSSFGTRVRHLYVPATVQQDGKTYKVTSIEEQAFAWKHHIETVVIADGIERIESQAFHNIIGLKSVVIPDSVTTIGFRAFSACYSLTSVVIPDSVTSMEERVFQDCDSLISATIGNGVTSIPSFMFSGCSSLINVTIGDKVSVIGQSAFADCTSIERIIIPDGVTEIQIYAFSNNPSLKTLIIPKSVTKIGQNICSNNLGIMKTGYGVYYGGSKSDWEKLNLGDGYNYHLHHANKYYSGEWSYSSDNINGGNHFIINSANFKVLSDGTIFAQGGRFGSGRLGSSDSAFISTTNMSGTTSFFPDSSSGSDVARTNWRLTVGSNFGVTSDGSLFASAIKLGGGTLGSDASVFISTTDMSGTLGSSSGGLNKTQTNWRLTVGSNFGVTSDGSLYAKGVDISGKIYANLGQIGNWYIRDGCITNSADDRVSVGDVFLTPSGITFGMESGNYTAVSTWSDIVNPTLSRVARATPYSNETIVNFLQLDGKTKVQLTFKNGILTNYATV